MADTVTLTIDDKQISVPAGTLVIDAARALGIEIPVFCSHPKLDPVGVCRMCMVEYVTPRGSRVDVSCTVPVTEGMVVRTNTPQVAAAREGILSFLLINHPLDCPICDKGGECPLQDQTMQYGPGASKFVEAKVHKAKHHPVSDLIILDQERCVLCWRCIRYLEEWEDRPQLALFNRGDRTVIDHFPDQPLDAKTSGSVIDICPVGALTDRTARFAYRPWELTKTPSICTHCPVGCNLRLDERVHELRRVVARPNPAVNDVWICDKGRFVHNFVDHADRLRQPLVRENDALRPASWEEAVDRVVGRLAALVDEDGPRAIGGIATGRVSNEAAYLFQKFFRALAGNNNVDFATGSAVRGQATGLPSLAEIGSSDLIVLVGIDTNESAPILDMLIKRAARRKKTKLIVIHPRRIELARYAGADLAVRPGAEAALLNGLTAAVLAKRDAAAGKRTATGAGQTLLDEWAWVRGQAPAATEARTGVSAAAVSAAAELLVAARRPLFLYGPDVAIGPRGRAAVAALTNLAGLLSQAERLVYVPTEANSQGLRDVGLLPNSLPGHQAVGDPAVAERLGRLWGVQPPADPGFTYREMLSGAVRGLFVMGANPAADPAAAEALRKLDFLAVQTLFLTETAQMADVVLPATSFAEADGTYTNLERRVQRAPRAIKEVGSSLPDWEILTRLAQRWLATRYTAPDAVKETGEKKQRRQGKGTAAPKAWHYSGAAAVFEEIGRAAPIYASLRWETLGTEGTQWLANALPRPARRIEPVETAGVPAPTQGAFWLISDPVLWNGGTLMRFSHPQTQARIPEPFVAINPADLAGLGLAAGARVTVASSQAAVSLVLRTDDTVRAGTAWVPAGLGGAPAERLWAGGEGLLAVTLRKD